MVFSLNWCKKTYILLILLLGGGGSPFRKEVAASLSVIHTIRRFCNILVWEAMVSTPLRIPFGMPCALGCLPVADTPPRGVSFVFRCLPTKPIVIEQGHFRGPGTSRGVLKHYRYPHQIQLPPPPPPACPPTHRLFLGFECEKVNPVAVV